MKNTTNPLKTTERFKLLLFGFVTAMFQGAKSPIFTSSKADLTLGCNFRSDSRRLAPIFLSVTWERKVGLHCDQQGLLKTTAWIYTFDFAQIQAVAQHPPQEQHSALCQTIHQVVVHSRLPLIIISSFSSIEAATPSTASKPRTQVAVGLLQLMGET